VCDHQMKRLVCGFARCLRVKVPSSTSSAPSSSSKADCSDADDFSRDGRQLWTPSGVFQPNETITETADKHPRPTVYVDCKKDWKLAAAVFDRLLLITFSILLIGGTVIFFSSFVLNYHPNDD